MSDVAQGPNWWIASDGKWYAPELHPSVREQSKASPSGGQTSTGNGRPQNSVVKGTRQFPDLFQAAMKGSSVADIVTVVPQNPSEYRPLSVGGAASAPTYYGRGEAMAATTTVDNPETSSKRKWRKSR